MKAADLDAAVEFFHEHAGFSYDPKTETADQGKRRTARELAAAEMCAAEQSWTVAWSDDWEVGDHQKEYDCYEDGGPETCESAVLTGSHGDMLAALGCIDDATDDYRRLIRAELAQQAMDENRIGTAECGTCHRLFPDLYPSARCPFEYDHEDEDETPTRRPITVFIVAEDEDGLTTGALFDSDGSATDYALDEGGRVFVVSGWLDLTTAEEVD
jgi:hypothetical protein